MNSLKALLHTDLTLAMKAREAVEVDTLRMALAAITNAEVAGDAAVNLSDDQVLDVLRAEAKKRSEAAEIYANAGRHAAAERELRERAVLDRYLPAALSDDELAVIIAQEVARASEQGATGPKAMGVVVKAVRARAASADGAKIAALVKSALT